MKAEWAMPAFIGLGLLTLPLYKADLLRERFVGDSTVPDNAVAAVVLVALAVAVMSLLRRDFVRVHPARLTWEITGDRAGLVRGGLRKAWAVRFAGVAYLFGAAGQVLGWSAAWLPGLLTVSVAAAVFGYVSARRPRKVWLEYLVPFGLAVAGTTFVSSGRLWAIAGGLVVATLVVWGPTARPRRKDLIRGHRAHVVRAVAAAFGDVLALLPEAGPVRGRLGGAVRFVGTGVLARRSMVAAAVLLALAAPVLFAVFPVVGPLWWAGIGGYLATLPFAGGLAEVTRGAGLRRWLPESDTALWAAGVAVLMVVAAVWLALAMLAGLPAAPAAVPVAAIAVARTVSRPDLDYTPSPAVDVAGAYVPVNLVRQLVRGPLFLLVGLAVLS